MKDLLILLDDHNAEYGSLDTLYTRNWPGFDLFESCEGSVKYWMTVMNQYV
jgi:hypothetical protein